jgi:hypothetical protein
MCGICTLQHYLVPKHSQCPPATFLPPRTHIKVEPYRDFLEIDLEMQKRPGKRISTEPFRPAKSNTLSYAPHTCPPVPDVPTPVLCLDVVP